MSDLICVSNSCTDPKTRILYKSIEIRYNLGPSLCHNHSYLNEFIRKIKNEDWDTVRSQAAQGDQEKNWTQYATLSSQVAITLEC